MNNREFLESLSAKLLLPAWASYEEVFERLDEIFLKDRGKTNEINLLTKGCRDQEAEIKRLRAEVDAVRLDVQEGLERIRAENERLRNDNTELGKELASYDTGVRILNERDSLRAENAALRERVAVLTACAEHYADGTNWDVNYEDEVDGCINMYQCGDGLLVAREALAKAGEEGKCSK